MTDYTRAMCVGSTADFTPDTYGPHVAQAAAVCQTCPLTAPCLAEARTDRLTGIYGGVYLDRGRPCRPGQHSIPLPPLGVRRCLGCGTTDLTGKRRYCAPCAAEAKRAAWRRYKDRLRPPLTPGRVL